MPRLIPDYRPGRQVTKRRPTPTEPMQVTAVLAREADEFFGTRTKAERERHVRGLDALGLLVRSDNPNRLTREVRVNDSPTGRKRERAYVLRCEPDEVPRRRRTRHQRERVTTW